MECNLSDEIFFFYLSNGQFKENYCKNICFLSEYIGGNVYLYSAGFYITYITNKSFFFILFIGCTG